MESHHPVLLAISLLLLCGASAASVPLAACSDLNVSGETYIMQNGVSGSMPGGTCMHISAARVTLRCDGHAISANNSSADRVGIMVEGENATVSGCDVSGYSYDPDTGFGLFAPGYDGLIVSNSSFSRNDYGMYAQSDRAHVSGTAASGNGYDGFHFISSSRMNVEGNNASGNGNDGFYVEAFAPKSYNNLSNNIAEYNDNNGFHLSDEDNNRLVGNNATGNGWNGFLVEFRAGGENPADGNVFLDNIATNNGIGLICLPGTFPCPNNGFVTDLANGTYFSGNAAEGNGGSGFFVYRGSFNVLEANAALGNMQDGFTVSSFEDTRRSHNNLTNNLASGNYRMGFFVQDDNNYLAYNNATENGGTGFYLDAPRCFSWTCSGDNNTLSFNRADGNGFGKPYCPDDGIGCYDGFGLAFVNMTKLTGNTASGNAGNGFGVYQGSFNALDSNNASGNSQDGFILDDSSAILVDSYNNLTRNAATANGGNGFSVYDDHNQIVRNRASGNSGNGFFIAPPTGCEGCSGGYNNLSLNTADANGNPDEGSGAGFMVNAAGNALNGNTAYGNVVYGFWVDSTIYSHVTGVTLSANRAYGHSFCGKAGCIGTGFRFSGTTVLTSSAFGADMSDNLAYGNDYGVLMFNGDLRMSGDRLYDNTIDLDAANPSDRVTSSLDASRIVFDSDSGAVSGYTTLSLADFLYYDGRTGTGEHYSIDHAVMPPGDYPYGQPFWDKFVNITDNCVSGCLPAQIDSIIWLWTGNEEQDYQNVTLWEYGGRGWALRNDSAVDYSLSLANLSGFSVFGLFANYSPVDHDDGGPQGGGEEGTGGQNQTAPECSSDDGCAVNEVCSNGSCEPLTCGCGSVQNHQCVDYECCSDAQCGAGKCDAAIHACVQQVPQFECTSDLQCPAQDFCKIVPGAAGGACEPVAAEGCGEVKNHTFAAYGYECGAEPGCPSCPSGSACMSHACVQYAITCPTTGIVGDTKTCSATRDNQPCAMCDYEVVAPGGKKSSGRTDESGNLGLPLDAEGTYYVYLMEGGTAVQSVQVKSFPQGKQSGAAKPEAQPEIGMLPVVLALLLAALALIVIFWRRRKGGKGQGKK